MPLRPAYSSLALIANIHKPAVRAAAARVAAICESRGVKLYAEPDAARAFKTPSIRPASRGQLAKKASLILSLGGDGTMLTSARIGAPEGVPVLGVNMGTLGFITPVPFEHLESALRDAFAGDYRAVKRSMLSAEVVRNGRVVEKRIALNDVVLLRGSSAKLAEIETRVDGRHQATYKADGLIIATPTGSTAYALSVGAPVLEPGSRTLVLAPISPHTLSVRPVVLGDDALIEILAPRSRSPLSFSSDGEGGFWLKANDTVKVRRYAKPALLLVPPDYDYWEVLRSKMGWRGN